jgi:signal transduction histidine kinase
VLALVGADQASLVGLAAELSRAGHAGAGRDVATVAIPLDAEPDAMLLATRPALPFARAEVVILDGLAQHAALAIELSRSRDEHDRLTVVTDRERIARELHDRVIQSLFAAGMGLESCLRLVPTGEAAARIRRSIDELDRAISELRSAIFETRPATRAGAGLRHRLLELVAGGGGNQAGEPNLIFEGPVDALPRDVQRHVLMLAHEGLVRLREQQAAGGLDLTVQAVDGSARIVFRTDRPGPGWQATVEQLAAHVAARGGEMEAASEPAGRARIEVRVPRPSGA